MGGTRRLRGQQPTPPPRLARYGSGMPPAAESLSRWCLTTGFLATQPAALLSGFVAQARARGVPIDRLMVTLRTLHPQLSAVGWFWEEGRDFTERQYRQVSTSLDAFKASPVRSLLDGTATRIHVPTTPEHYDRYPIIRDLGERGFTDYLALAVIAGDGRPNVLSVSTRAPGGFTSAQIQALDDAMPALGAVLDRNAVRIIAHNICTTYIGRFTGQRVWRGVIQRGAVEALRAAVWFSDLRSFTARSAAMGARDTVALLNQWFGVVGEAIEAEGGEILKFIGDAALVVFPVQGGDDGDACRRALASAHRTRAGVQGVETPDGAPIEFGVGLSLGEVAYGNIGAPLRLDFTVIGDTVNRASRLEGLCSALGEPVLADADFAAAVGQPMTALGEHTLKGIPRPVAVYRPQAPAPSAGAESGDAD